MVIFLRETKITVRLGIKSQFGDKVLVLVTPFWTCCLSLFFFKQFPPFDQSLSLAERCDQNFKASASTILSYCSVILIPFVDSFCGFKPHGIFCLMSFTGCDFRFTCFLLAILFISFQIFHSKGDCLLGG